MSFNDLSSVRAYCIGRLDSGPPPIVTECNATDDDFYKWWTTEPGKETWDPADWFDSWCTHLAELKQAAWREAYHGYILNAFMPDSRADWSKDWTVPELHLAAEAHADDMWRVDL